MSNILIEKRTELLSRKASLEASRQAEIDAKVEAYRISLENSTPNDDIMKIVNVIAALDEVIGYDNATSTQAHVATAYSSDSESVVTRVREPRAGMASVVMPKR